MATALNTPHAPDPHLPLLAWLPRPTAQPSLASGMAGFLVQLPRVTLEWLAQAAIDALDALDGDPDLEPETVEHGEAA